MTNIQSKIDLLKQRAIDLEVENAKLKQIIKENAKHKANNVNLSAENAKFDKLLRRGILKSGLSTAWLDDLMEEWEKTYNQFVENAKLKQIIKENAKHKANNVNLSAENAKVKIELRRAMGENAKLKAESLREVKTRERIEKTMLDLDGCLYRKSLSMK
ncbi:hypothetical protein Glove_413g20 [Diversispora epigaea]|uniref:Uncharacterized protein n=1 Tax=Diversispora epigaea TaxID=1348612 RepID=A0A397H181_9GLOM|nr:hypothetical protein Glove_413g20 [Diversispora epigaea]